MNTSVPRRLLVSPRGRVHRPDCPTVPLTAEHDHWGELTEVAPALRALATGVPVTSQRPGKPARGPDGQQACHRCLAAVVAQRKAHDDARDEAALRQRTADRD